MLNTLTIGTLAISACSAANPAAASRPAPAPPEVAIHVNEHTLLAVHADLERLDVAAWFDFFAAPIEATLARQDDPATAAAFAQWIARGRGTAAEIVTELRKAGITDLVLTMSVDQLGSPVVAASGAQVDIERTKLTLAPLGFRDARVAHGAVLLGTTVALDAHVGRAPALREDLLAALEVGEGSALRIALAPPSYMRRALIETSTSLPPNLGGAPLRPVLETAQWAALAAREGHGAEGLAVLAAVDCATSAGAKTTRAFLSTTLERALVGSMTDPARAAALLTPALEGSRLTLVARAERLGLLADQALPWLMRSRATALRTESMQRVRSILMGCHLYASAHDNAWPPNLAALVEAGHLQADQLDDPRYDDEPFVYVRPAGDVARNFDAQRVLVHEHVPADATDVVVGFADGHVELVTRERFAELRALQQRGAAREESEQQASMMRVRRILLACSARAHDFDDVLPESLDALVKLGTLDPALLRNDYPASGAGYEYRRPARVAVDADPTRAMVWERLDTWRPAGAVVGFVDGHVELVTSEERYRALTGG